MIREGSYAGNHDPHSAEVPDRKIEELLLSGERCGEGGKAVIIKISPERLSPDLRSAFFSLSGMAEEKEIVDGAGSRKAVKLFKLYLPHKGRNEYEMHAKTYDALQEIPEDTRKEYAKVPELSSLREVTFDDEMRQQLEEQFHLPHLGEKSQLITMEYIDGEDLATVFYKWILEREGISSARTDAMDFVGLFEEVAKKLNLETLPDDADIPQNVAELAEWKLAVQNTEKIYAYLRKNNLPLPGEVASRVENTLQLMHREKITHGDAFERNIMITGGMKALRERGTLQGEDVFLIDFGEARNRFVEGVDDFKVVRRLKTLSVSRDDERKKKDEGRMREISMKADLLREHNQRWRIVYKEAEKLAKSNSQEALSYLWHRIVPQRETAVEDFVIAAQGLIVGGLMTKENVSDFMREKEAEMRRPYERTLMRECIEWLNLSK